MTTLCTSQEVASAFPIIITHGGSMASYRYGETVRRNASFDGRAFVDAWQRSVGSSHRHFKTRELVLFWSPRGPHPEERNALREQLEADPGNVGEVLAAIDARDEAFALYIDTNGREGSNG